MIRPSLALAALLAAASPALAQDDGSLVWGLNRYAEPAPGDAGVRLFYGLPRSGFLVISASCDLSGPAPVIEAEIWGDPGARANGTAVTASLTAPGQPPAELSGTIVGVGSEMGITGIAARLPLDAPHWRIFASGGPVQIALEGGEPIEVTGDPASLNDFLALCADRGGPTCEDLDQLASTEAGQPLDIAVESGVAALRRLFWIDTGGNPVEIGQLQPNETGTLGSDMGHVWMAADEDGACVQVFEAARTTGGIGLYVWPSD